MTAPVAELHRRFAIPGVAAVVDGYGGLPVVRITSPIAHGEIYLHGGHVTSWQPGDAGEVLFVSDLARFADGTAIRGGIPICFPWFGGHPDRRDFPAHGFARTGGWLLTSVERGTGQSPDDEADSVTVTLEMSSDNRTRAWWPHEFRLSYRVTFGSTLRLALTVGNTGTSPLRCDEALHTYFRVGHIERTRVAGLDGVRYLDQTDARRERLQQQDIVFTGETDRIYLDVPDRIEVHDTAGARTTQITSSSARTAVVWNPWIDKARALTDFADDEWQRMVCVETCNVADFPVHVEPGQSHTMRVTVTTKSTK